MKRSALIFTLSVLPAIFFSCKGEKKKFIMAEVNPTESMSCRMDQFFCDEVKALSKGSIEIELAAAGVLGDEFTVIDEMRTGKKIDIARVSTMSMNKQGHEKLSLLTLPYTFNNRDHFWKFAKSELAKDFLSESAEGPDGLVGLFFAEEGFRHFFSTKKLDTYEDLKGHRIRVASDPILSGVVNDMNAIPVELKFTDLMKAMVLGNIDTAEQPLINYSANHFDSVAKNVILDGHTIGVIEVIITKQAWDSLKPKEQEILRKASSAAADYGRKIVEDQENSTIEKLINEGVVFTEVTDKTPWKNICATTISKHTSNNAELYRRIVEMGDGNQ